MLTATPTPRAVMDARWAAFREALHDVHGHASPPPRPSNVRAILDLGNLTYFEFRGRAYGVPPLAWQQGEAMLDAWLEIRNLGEEISGSVVVPYYAALQRLTRMAWRNVRPATRWRRALRRVGLMRNPFRAANEREIADIALFFLGLRTKSTGSFRPGPDAQQML